MEDTGPHRVMNYLRSHTLLTFGQMMVMSKPLVPFEEGRERETVKQLYLRLTSAGQCTLVEVLLLASFLARLISNNEPISPATDQTSVVTGYIICEDVIWGNRKLLYDGLHLA